MLKHVKSKAILIFWQWLAKRQQSFRISVGDWLKCQNSFATRSRSALISLRFQYFVMQLIAAVRRIANSRGNTCSFELKRYLSLYLLKHFQITSDAGN